MSQRLVDEFARFSRKTKLPLGKSVGNVLARLPDEGQFQVVDHARHIHTHQGDDVAFEEVPQEKAEGVFDEVGAGHPDDRFTLRPLFEHRPGEDLDLFRSVSDRLLRQDLRSDNVGGQNLVLSLGKRIQIDPPRIEKVEFSAVFHARARTLPLLGD